jgi:hypothetical protein
MIVFKNFKHFRRVFKVNRVLIFNYLYFILESLNHVPLDVFDLKHEALKESLEDFLFQHKLVLKLNFFVVLACVGCVVFNGFF